MEPTLNDLPNSVREIAAVIGRESTLRLIGKLPTCYAGANGKKSTRVIMYVPKRLPPDHQLVRILGWNTANKLVRHFGGEILYPANCRGIYAKYRDDAILRMLQDGARASMVAELMGLSERHVRNLLREKPQEDATPEKAKNPSVLSDEGESHV